jgi:KaiC/GvpD/RAD55 family RecA-like ATPase
MAAKHAEGGGMREKEILASAIKNREAFEAVVPHVDHQDFSEQGWVIWQGIRTYYDNDSAASVVDAGVLSSSVTRLIAADKHKEMFKRLVQNLESMEVSPSNIVVDLIETKRDVVGKQLAQAIVSGRHDWDLLSSYQTLMDADALGTGEEEDEARQGFSVAELVADRFDPSGLIRVLPSALNDRLDGGVKPGHHIVLFARPEMGKTMMTIEMMSGFARQGHTVLYIGNEDPLDDITMRVVNRLSGMTKPEVMANPDKADHLAREAGYENIILQSLAPGTAREITKLIDKYKPDVLVLDQLRNLNMHQDNYVLALEGAAKQARQWAKRYSCVVVSVTQAGDSASGKAVLDLGDVDYSNTGIPAQADLMIGMGQTANHAANGEIVLSLPKNKISGNHEYFACSIEPQLSKINSLG